MLAFHLPLRWPQMYARLANWVFWVVLGGWLCVLALWAVVHGVIVPRIEDFRPWLQERASAALGHRVVIGAISARSHGWVPEVELRDLQLLDDSGQPRLVLNRVTLALTPTSLLQGEFSQVTLHELDLDVRRDTQGRLWVAGLMMQESDDNRLRNWVFAQWEWVVRDSQIRWIDEARQRPVVSWRNLEAVLRNGLRDHRLHVDLTPETDWGERLSVRGHFKQPLFSTQSGLWETWSGQLYVQASRLNLAPWSNLLPTSWPQLEGQGWARAWLEWREGKLHDWTADAQFKQVRVEPQKPYAMAAWAAAELSGRLTWSGGNTEKWVLQNAQMNLHDAPVWPVKLATLTLKRDAQGELLSGAGQIDEVNLASLQAWSHWAPSDWQKIWRQAAPQGRLQQVQWQWTGPWDDPKVQQWQMRAVGVSLQAGPSSKAQPMAPWPGVTGLGAELSGQGDALKGQVRVQAGQLSWPGVWDGPAHRVSEFKSELELARTPQGHRLRLKSAQAQLDQLRANFDLAWSNTEANPWGELQLAAQVPQATVGQIQRWLPLTLSEPVRQYVKMAVLQGEARQIKAHVTGALRDFPFEQPGSGEFRIEAQLSKVRYQTVPTSLRGANVTGEWPLLQDLSGELVFDRGSMHLNQVKARLAMAPNIAWGTLEAHIRQLSQAVVEVKAEGKGPLAEALTMWRAMPLHAWTDRALEGTRAQGMAEYRMALSIPLAQTSDTRAKGTVNWQGNEVSMMPGAPTLTRLRGALSFTESGFELQGAQAELWGGEVKLEGGTLAQGNAATPSARLRAQGQLSARGLQNAPELADWAPQLKQLQGHAAYQAQLQWRRGQLETQVNSDLVGLAVQAPTGLGKPAATALPLRWESSLTQASAAGTGPMQEQLVLNLGSGLEARYVRDLSGPQAQVLRGLIRWGARSAAAMPAQGVVLRVQADQFNLDEWTDWLQPFTQLPGQGGGWNYAPQRLEFQSAQVTAQGRRLNQVVLNAARQGDGWQGQVRSRELEGELAYWPQRAQDAARLQARLARLTIPASALDDAENLLDVPSQDLPTLDVQIQALELKGKKLGALELLAQNRRQPDGMREWQLSKLLISNEDGSLQADGWWRKPVSSPVSLTAFDFKLNLKNAGAMLQRLGLPDAVRNGSGALSGKITWNGSPMAPAVGSMNGQFRVDVERGQFLKTEPGAARLLGVLSLQALPRRLMLDFRDVFSEGFAFDFFRGDVKIEQGLASSQNLQMKGVNVAVLMEGQANIAQETQDLKVLVIPDINAGGASLIYSAINPVVGLTTFLAQYVLRRPLMESATQQFHVDGTWSDPRVTQVPFKADVKP